MTTLERIVSDNLCTGCGLCAGLGRSAGVEMTLNPGGFLRPTGLNRLDPDTRATLTRACPGASIRVDVPENGQHPYWGPVRRALTGHARDPDLRYKGASGGALSAFLAHLLDSGAVTGVIQIRASRQDARRSAAVLTRNGADLAEAAGSRYAPAAPLDSILNQLHAHDRLAFVGKPCDCAGLGAFLAGDPALAEKLVVRVSFFCGGTPSQHATDSVIRKIGMAPDRVRRLRYRGEGWPGGVKAVDDTGAEATMSYAESWGGVFSGRLQHRCKICPDGTGHTADIVFADAWYGDDTGYPLFDEAEGRSLILSRTDQGDTLLDRAIKAGHMAVTPLDMADVAAMQPYHVARKRTVPYRLMALALLGRARPRFEGLNLARTRWHIRPFDALRNLLGMGRRVALALRQGRWHGQQ